jgi:hypothetical protein
MARMMVDCRRWPSDINCSLTIIGEPEELVDAAARHAATAHGHEDTPALREQLRGFMEPEAQYQPGTRTPEPFPA